MDPAKVTHCTSVTIDVPVAACVFEADKLVERVVQMICIYDAIDNRWRVAQIGFDEIDGTESHWLWILQVNGIGMSTRCDEYQQIRERIDTAVAELPEFMGMLDYSASCVKVDV
jgi:hypothetical protein